jgi:NAD(P)H-hydrate epimerase
LIVAVDGPSGLEYDSGELDPQALSADITVTFAYPKHGHYVFPGAAACGTLVVADIGVDPDLTQELLGEATLQVATAGWIGEFLPERPADAHKGTFGRALVVAGSINYTGAAYLAASSASHVGAGLVTLGVPAAIHGALAAQISEATYLILPQAMGVINAGAVELLLEKMDDYEAMLIGPGLTQEKETVEFVHKLFQAQAPSKRPGRLGFQVGTDPQESQEERPDFPPLVIDADGLNALAALEDETWWERIPAPSVLTPHPGEMARLADCEIQAIQADRPGVARQMAERWGHVVVLKGAHTVVAAPEGRTVLLPFATPAMATAGTGDVLAGAIVGLLAQGLPAFEAALAGAYVHGLAGTWAGEEIGPAGVVASDLLLRLPRALWRLQLV